MKMVTFENIYNKEQFVSFGKKEVKYIDGIEYVKMFKPDNKREVFVRKDFLKKVNIAK
jgi:hypothetical protein